MLVVVAYDVNTETKEGRSRLRRAAKVCVNFGQRVQNSVFECQLDPVQFFEVKTKLLKIIDPQKDSIRFYNLGNKYKTKIEQYGAKQSYMPDDLMMF